MARITTRHIIIPQYKYGDPDEEEGEDDTIQPVPTRGQVAFPKCGTSYRQDREHSSEEDSPELY